MTMNVTRTPSRPSLKFSLDAGSQRIVGYHDGGAASATEPSDSSEPSDMAAIIRTRTRVTVPQERSAENTYPRIATEQPAPNVAPVTPVCASDYVIHGVPGVVDCMSERQPSNRRSGRGMTIPSSLSPSQP